MCAVVQNLLTLYSIHILEGEKRSIASFNLPLSFNHRKLVQVTVTELLLFSLFCFQLFPIDVFLSASVATSTRHQAHYSGQAVLACT